MPGSLRSRPSPPASSPRRDIRRYRALRAALWGTAVLAGSLSQAHEAHACGGLFCSTSQPVVQTAERILFAKNDDDTITAIIEVQYQGPSEKFGWLLPMPGTPKVAVSTKAALDAVDLATQPSYTLSVKTEGDCHQEDYTLARGVSETDTGSTNPTVAPVAANVTVLDQGNAGPYDYVTISPDPELDDAAQAAVDWLEDNGYDVGTGADVLRPYLSQGMNLIAFRLTKGRDTGAIQPIQLTYSGNVPSIPITPTAVAASEDMGIRVFLLGDARAIAENYDSLTLNQARINWFNWTSGYDEVVTEAADEAGGYGFVTEFAGSTDNLAQTIWTPSLQSAWANLTDSPGTGAEVMVVAANTFRSYEGFRRAAELSTTLPDDLDLATFGFAPVSYEQQYGITIVDKQAFLDELETNVIVPLQQAQALVDNFPYLSRLYTTLSPHEMTMDPSFVYSAELEPVSNRHTATQTVLCNPDVFQWEAPWVIALADGSKIYGDGSRSSTVLSDLALPAAATIESAGGETVVDNSSMIRTTLAAAEPNPPPVAENDGCSISAPGGRAGGRTPTSALMLGLLALGVALRRRNRRAPTHFTRA